MKSNYKRTTMIPPNPLLSPDNLHSSFPQTLSSWERPLHRPPSSSSQNLHFFVSAPPYTSKCRLLQDNVEQEFKMSTF